LRTEF
jgi:hypothetical protein